jgi:hypothetical protein
MTFSAYVGALLSLEDGWKAIVNRKVDEIAKSWLGSERGFIYSVAAP